MTRLTARKGYHHQFSRTFLHPKYWGVWMGVFGLILLAFIPFRLRDKFASFVGKVACKKAQKQRHKAEINLRYCFPDWSLEKQRVVIENMFICVAQTMLATGEMAIRSPKYLQSRIQFNGIEHIEAVRSQGKNVILLVPHTWSIDVSGTVLTTMKMPMTSMYNPHRNPLVDWLWNITRERFGGKMHTRQNGIKPFLNDVKKGKLGYFLPDEDFGEKGSVYVDFFATEKATLPGLTKMAKLTNAEVIPLFPIYNAEEGCYQVEILSPMTFSGKPEQAAREMNKVIEYFVTKNPEQYVWILKLLKTRRDGKDIYC
ncbi:lauroyl-Kdo(2)-lipid IV(A) myristoyltransferase [Pasteurella atlantica]|uniref:Lauroyl-Kdo(2)-lipid IV(A) myristoyltransferase n=2 Tax=Pasteurellaceae TaxID=712 RepID=A0ACC6HKD3_9PAST|nr:lauroyl-Kdo(2)-lipid IV(A) myristoyltransferase [Pasteurella atlantica]MDP8051325.1 lauroyl-Kdo(2)-lipid IV(A) myristoyltransferase [Pasteurella atlantica]MDP8099718.1 lauroyl-Kdo(2)-lipid IV(A) myristoyltransferase [Pasteurella atlantica]MDP8100322.1 lauroyl-Kdo(2)-lipid IV(A) myristoyltransferase [Pasteurella atlantica]MDP8104620.1 lauroyl-Kdo(2)-lipid IV(A) myristoyltransferase [Pasteurella atlantica]MDP8107786.1 lauroyl-Kdo(2)-lipid IV(A) myristoyltransferase [Pasteurella atlantica]